MVSFIKVEGKILEGKFKKRLTRFSALAKIENKNVVCFLPNPGRLRELLKPNAKLILKEAGKGERKTVYDIIGVYHDGQRVSVDSRFPNKLVLEALKNKDILELSQYNVVKPEHRYGRMRFDFLLSNKQNPCLLEVKSCTLVRGGVAMFPDAKTERGTRHVLNLVKAKSEGYRTCILFIVQRVDAKLFTPNDETDPKFGKALRQAYSRGVEVYAYSSKFLDDKIVFERKIPVKL
ncbi:MAG: DNA/RNA nuclease SfsA [Candidatus Bathycorpusculaceae bacterium]